MSMVLVHTINKSPRSHLEIADWRTVVSEISRQILYCIRADHPLRIPAHDINRQQTNPWPSSTLAPRNPPHHPSQDDNSPPSAPARTSSCTSSQDLRRDRKLPTNKGTHAPSPFPQLHPSPSPSSFLRRLHRSSAPPSPARPSRRSTLTTRASSSWRHATTRRCSCTAARRARTPRRCSARSTARTWRGSRIRRRAYCMPAPRSMVRSPLHLPSRVHLPSSDRGCNFETRSATSPPTTTSTSAISPATAAP